MVASNELEIPYFLDTAKMLFNLAADISKEFNISFEFLNLGGGIGIPYHPNENPGFDVAW